MASPIDLLRKTKGALVRSIPQGSPPSVEVFDSPTPVSLGPDDGADASGLRPVSITPASYQASFEPPLPAKFEGWSPLVATVPRGRIVGVGAGVVDAQGRVVKQSLWDEDHFRRDFGRRLPSDRVSHPGAATSLLTLWHENYYHWLIDALPRLGVLEAAGRNFRELPIIVPDPLTRFQSQSLDALGIGTDQRIPFDGSSVRVDELVWASAAAPIGFCSSFIPRWLRNQFVPPEGPSASVDGEVRQRRRLFVSRRVRSVANEEELWPILDRHRFELVRPETLSFTDQVALFASAEMVVGPHGAGMANVVFGRDLSVLELFQPGYLNTGPAQVCRAAGHVYRAMVGTPVARPGPAKDTDIHLDPAEFERILIEMTGDRQTAWPH